MLTGNVAEKTNGNMHVGIGHTDGGAVLCDLHKRNVHIIQNQETISTSGY